MRRCRHLVFLVLVAAGGICAGTAAKLGAQEVLRVKRGGVIYYHFNDRSASALIRSRAAGSGPFSLHARPVPRKVTVAELQPHIQQAGSQHNLPPALIKALIRVESNFNPGATSPKGAQGLMQLMPETAAALAVQDPYDVRQNIWGGARYFSHLLQRFNHRLPLALAAYNAGPGRVERSLAVPPLPETQKFVRAVCAAYLRYRAEETGNRSRP